MHEISCYRIMCKGGQILLLRFKAMSKSKTQKTSLNKILSTTFRLFKGCSVPKTQTTRHQCHYIWKTRYRRWDRDIKDWRWNPEVSFSDSSLLVAWFKTPTNPALCYVSLYWFFCIKMRNSGKLSPRKFPVWCKSNFVHHFCTKPAAWDVLRHYPCLLHRHHNVILQL